MPTDLWSSGLKRVSATGTVYRGSIPGTVETKANTIKSDIQSLSTRRLAIKKGIVNPAPRLNDRWQFDSKTERSLRCLLVKATWRLKTITNCVLTENFPEPN